MSGVLFGFALMGAELGSRVSGGTQRGALIGAAIGLFCGAVAEMAIDRAEDDAAHASALNTWEGEGGQCPPEDAT